MVKSILELLIGNIEEKKSYHQFRKRVKALPKDYRFAFRKIQHYIYCVGGTDGNNTIFTDLSLFENLVELFEISASEGKKVLDVIGRDIGKFSDEFIRASVTNTDTAREQLNKEIMEKFSKEEL